MTNTATVIHQCGDGHDVALPATMITGNAPCTTDGCTSWVDVSHGYRHIGWCTVCGGIDSEHTGNYRVVEIDGDTDPSEIVGAPVAVATHSDGVRVGTVERLECTRPVVRFTDGTWTYGDSTLHVIDPFTPLAMGNPTLVPTIACEECGAPSGARCTSACTSDEATRYGDPFIVDSEHTGNCRVVEIYWVAAVGSTAQWFDGPFDDADEAHARAESLANDAHCNAVVVGQRT